MYNVMLIILWIVVIFNFRKTFSNKPDVINRK